jgi:hypothetical protein
VPEYGQTAPGGPNEDFEAIIEKAIFQTRTDSWNISKLLQFWSPSMTII